MADGVRDAAGRDVGSAAAAATPTGETTAADPPAPQQPPPSPEDCRRRWLDENRAALAANEAWLEEHGLPLERHRLF